MEAKDEKNYFLNKINLSNENNFKDDSIMNSITEDFNCVLISNNKEVNSDQKCSLQEKFKNFLKMRKVI